MPRNNFEYGIGAVVAPNQRDNFTSRTHKLIEDTRPANFLEQLVVDQLLHAQWELHRVNSLTSHFAAEEDLLKASTRATRNWTRATRELAALQTARASQTFCRVEGESRPGPCADLTKVPKRRGPSAPVRAEHNAHVLATSLNHQEAE